MNRWLEVRVGALPDRHGNHLAAEGVDRCHCGCKYWEGDRCVDCGCPVPRLN